MPKGGKPLQSGLMALTSWPRSSHVSKKRDMGHPWILCVADVGHLSAVQCENAPTCLGSKSNFTNPSR